MKRFGKNIRVIRASEPRPESEGYKAFKNLQKEVWRFIDKRDYLSKKKR